VGSNPTPSASCAQPTGGLVVGRAVVLTLALVMFALVVVVPSVVVMPSVVAMVAGGIVGSVARVRGAGTTERHRRDNRRRRRCGSLQHS
jgi:hypothetical protein